MKHILVTHTGSLPRPPSLQDLLYAREQGRPVDQRTVESQARAAVNAVVRQQVECGLDIINDGEQSKVSYATYVKDRLTGFRGESHPPTFPGLPEAAVFPEFYRGPFMQVASSAFAVLQFPGCNGPIAYTGGDLIKRDITNLQEALDSVGRSPEGAFMTAASPGTIASWLSNDYYSSYEEYLSAIAAAMKVEYDAIASAGFLLQVDCPDLQAPTVYQIVTEGRRKVDDSELRAWHVRALNAALRDIPPERLRMHICWGNYEAPHTSDVPLREFIGAVLRARPSTLVLEAANPRHAHEWRVFEEVRLPEDKRIVLGVLDTTTNFVEHPQLVAERLVRVARLVGRERVMAGTDCGFATFAGMHPVDPGIAWAKLAAMVEGARLASQQLFG